MNILAGAFALVFTMPPALDQQLLPCRDVVHSLTENHSAAAANCRLFIPARYDRKTRYPLVVFLHGGGGRGTDSQRHLREGNGLLVHRLIEPAAQRRFPAFVVAPQTASRHDTGAVHALIDAITATFSIDPRRIYIVGQSLGGYAAFSLLARQPTRFAAAVIIAAGAQAADLRELPTIRMWVFHGAKDNTVPVEEARRIVAALRRAGAKPRYTEYAGEGHGLAWLVVRERNLVPWLFAQRATE